MAKRQSDPQRTSKGTSKVASKVASKGAEPVELDAAEGRTNRLSSDADAIDEARARAHERARERTGSDD